MTLLTFARGNDGFVLVSDRKESASDGSRNEVDKFYLDADGKFFLALAGDAAFNKPLFTHLKHGCDSTDTVVNRLKSYRREYYARRQNAMHSPAYGAKPSNGFLILKENKEYTPHTVRFIEDDFIIGHNNARFYAVGDSTAKRMVWNTLRHINFLHRTCEMLARYIIASAANAAQEVGAVGDMGYGFDVFAFMKKTSRSCAVTDMRTR